MKDFKRYANGIRFYHVEDLAVKEYNKWDTGKLNILETKLSFCQEWLRTMICSHRVLKRTYLCYLHLEVDVLHQETYYSSAEKGGPVAKDWGFPVSWRGCCIPNCYGWTLGWRLASQSWGVEQPVGAEKKIWV